MLRPQQNTVNTMITLRIARYILISNKRIIFILLMLLLATPLLAQDELREGTAPDLVGIAVGFPSIEIPQETTNYKLLLPLLKHKSIWIRAEAAKALGEMGKQEAVPSLKKSLRKDRSPYVRFYAAWALGEIGGKDSLSTLEKALKKEKHHRVQMMLANCIGRIESGYLISPELD